MNIIVYIVGAFVFAAPVFLLLGLNRSSRYPDGNCYLCRRGPIDEHDVCKNCGTKQLM